jgi:hypothetical protein
MTDIYDELRSFAHDLGESGYQPLSDQVVEAMEGGFTAT